MEWQRLRAPSLEEFETLVTAAYRELPAEFRSLCEEIVVQVAEFPDESVCEDLELDSPFDLLGLYHGVNRLDRSVLEPTHMPEMITLYRRPILDYWSEHDESLSAIIAHVLIHEIGHHFGLSDADMERIESDLSE